MTHFDPNAASPKDSGIFGLPFTENEAKLILLPIPWEATTSYGGGTSNGPKSILAASKQIDLFDLELGKFYEKGIAMLPESKDLRKMNDKAKKAAQAVIEKAGEPLDAKLKKNIADVNDISEQVNRFVYQQTKDLLTQGKYVGIVGGDHSSPLGAIQAFLEQYPDMGILHFDAHADLRIAFEGFEYSHASIMYNVISKTSLKKLVQVGIRDFCEEEYDIIQNNDKKIITYFGIHLAEEKFNGKTWSQISDDIIQHLPKEVYISFDIDGLDPRYCQHTGTPVPGGLDLAEALFLIKKVAQSGRKIIGFDLNEVSPGVSKKSTAIVDPSAEWDANVGARLLYKLCGWTLVSQEKSFVSPECRN